ncbi:MAG: PIN domain nuclease [Desulfobacula sp.]|nr:PIN domain nuclease [Desulfobacula sp.]
MILVDSSVWIDYFNGKPSWQADLLDYYLSEVPIIMGDLIFLEVLQGFRSDKDFKTAKSFLSALPFRPMVGYNVALKSAQTYRELRKIGISIRKTIDVIIAVFCITHGFTLLHDDRDFDPISAHFPLKTSKPY